MPLLLVSLSLRKSSSDSSSPAEEPLEEMEELESLRRSCPLTVSFRSSSVISRESPSDVMVTCGTRHPLPGFPSERKPACPLNCSAICAWSSQFSVDEKFPARPPPPPPPLPDPSQTGDDRENTASLSDLRLCLGIEGTGGLRLCHLCPRGHTHAAIVSGGPLKLIQRVRDFISSKLRNKRSPSR